MALSTFDMLNMKPDDQKKITMATDMWNQAKTQEEKDSWHNYAESIRASYGYSGDTKTNFNSGSGYTQTGFAIPRLGDYSQTENGLKYSQKFDEILSQIDNREPFTWNPETDEGYQAFMGQVTRMAEKTFNDTIAGASVGTGGRPNSWAGTVASQSMGDMLMQGASQMQSFKEMAYQMYKDEGQLDFQKLEALMSIDNTMYARFVDQYNSEVNVYNSAIEQKERDIQNALNRTELAGYVSNADALILGVPVGTLSMEARQRAWDMEDYLAKAKIDLAYTPRSGGGGSGGDPDDPDSQWKWNQVEGYLSNYKGLGLDKNGKVKGTPALKSTALIELHKMGYINEADLLSYGVEIGADIQAIQSYTEISDDDTAEGGSVDSIDRELASLRGFSLPEMQLQRMTIIITAYEEKRITKEQAYALAVKYKIPSLNLEEDDPILEGRGGK